MWISEYSRAAGKDFAFDTAMTVISRFCLALPSDIARELPQLPKWSYCCEELDLRKQQ